MPEQTHIIHHAAINISSNAWMDSGQTKQWVQQQLLEIVEEVFNEMCDANTWLTLDRLILELDNSFQHHLPADSMKHQIRSQVEQALKNEFNQPEPIGNKPEASLRYSSLVNYLQQGTFKDKQAFIAMKHWLQQPNAVFALSAEQRQQLFQTIQHRDAFIRLKQLAEDELQWKALLLSILPSLLNDGLSFPEAWNDLLDSLALPSGKQRDLVWLAAVQSMKQQPHDAVPYFLQQVASLGIDLKTRNASLPTAWQQALATLNSSTAELQKHIEAETNGNVADDASITSGSIARTIHTANGGVVLLSPFLPRLFEQLNLHPLEEKDSAATILLIHFLATGNSHAEDWELALPKLLCAYPIDQTVNQDLELPQSSMHAAEELLQAAIAHWEKLGNTSTHGLRHSFLQRDGRLLFNSNNTSLKIAERTEDILLQFVPWNFRLIKLPWMHRLLQVDWA